jgi:hypothetical protein
MWPELARNLSECAVPVKSVLGTLHRYKSEALMLAGFMGIMNQQIPRMAPTAVFHLNFF